MRPKMTLIAPNEDIYEVGVQVVKEEGFNCDVIIGNLALGAQLAKASADEGSEVLISRGGTYLDICQMVDPVPCVPINVSTIDLFNAIQLAAKEDHRIGVVGYSNTIYDAASLGASLDYEIVEILVENPEQLYQQLKDLSQSGLKVIVGDTISVKVALELGLHGILISSGKRAVYEALVRAEDIALVRKKDALSKARIETIVNSVEEGIIATDQEGRITHCNQVAMEFFGVTGGTMVGRALHDWLPDYNGSEEILSLLGSQYLVTTRQLGFDGSLEDGYVIVLKALRAIQEAETLVRKKLHSQGLIAKHTIDDIVGISHAVKSVKQQLLKISETGATVLIIGRTGVGKEMIAQSIHNLSGRRERPFVAVNCAAFSENLLESELFGYVEGSFTDARKSGKQGLFELAHRGTIFLDEISEMSLSVQAKVLRVMQEREVMRLGDDRIIPVDIRILAATNFDLWTAVQQKKFREDLFYRVNVISLEIPTLVDRKEDIQILAAYYLNTHAPLIKVEPFCFENLKLYDWPGNVRQLFNFMQQMIIFSEGNLIRKASVDQHIEKLIKTQSFSHSTFLPKSRLTDEIILETLSECGGNQMMAANLLGVDRTTLWRRLKKMSAD